MVASSFFSLGRQNATLGSFTGDGFGRFGLESCWGSAVSQPRSTELLSDEGATSTELLSKPVACPAGVSLLAVASLHHLSFSLGRQKATLESFKGDGSGRFWLESCWGSAVSEPRSTKLLSDEGATSTELLSKPVACPAGVSLLVVALLGFLCLWLHHLSFL